MLPENGVNDGLGTEEAAGTRGDPSSKCVKVVVAGKGQGSGVHVSGRDVEEGGILFDGFNDDKGREGGFDAFEDQAGGG